MCIWVEDADRLNIDSRELNIVYSNRVIDSYLNGNNSLGLAGIKGQGKTFLIKVKRKSIEDKGSGICLPFSKMVDTVDSSFSIDRSLFRYLKDYSVWVDLWKFAICGSILSNDKTFINLPLSKLKPLTKQILLLKNSRAEPSFLFKELLKLQLQDFRSSLEDTSILFNELIGTNKPIYIFIDKLDQGLSNFLKNAENTYAYSKYQDIEIWKFAQYALAECAYDIYTNASQHIKVFFTIRQEVLIDSHNLNKDKARNINSFISTLDYNKADLEAIYRLYIQNEDEKNLHLCDVKNEKPSEAFIGYEKISHGYVEKEENLFDYIYRHTFKRPYDIMKICRKLYFQRPKNNALIDIQDLRHEVNIESNNLLDLYLEELSVFLPYKREEIYKMIELLPGNIANTKILMEICSIYTLKYNKKFYCNNECISCSMIHPFSVLSNLGLLGHDVKHAADKNSLIVFENIGKTVLNLNNNSLPSADFYFLHPALSNKARDLRNNKGFSFLVSHSTIIGDRCELLRHETISLKKEFRKIFYTLKKEQVFISSTIYDLTEERNIIKNILEERNLHPKMSEHKGFNVFNTQTCHSHDHCLNEVKNCGSFVFILGTEYGGKYSGEKYQKEYNEIIENSKYKISTPSISLMEFYVARKNKLKCYVFINKNTYDKIKKQPELSDMCNEINFINHFATKGRIIGNWIIYYQDVTDLAERIKECKFI